MRFSAGHPLTTDSAFVHEFSLSLQQAGGDLELEFLERLSGTTIEGGETKIHIGLSY